MAHEDARYHLGALIWFTDYGTLFSEPKRHVGTMVGCWGWNQQFPAGDVRLGFKGGSTFIEYLGVDPRMPLPDRDTKLNGYLVLPSTTGMPMQRLFFNTTSSPENDMGLIAE